MKSQISIGPERGGGGGEATPNGRLSDTSGICSGEKGGGGNEAAPNGRLSDTSALYSGRRRGGGALLAIQK